MILYFELSLYSLPRPILIPSREDLKGSVLFSSSHLFSLQISTIVPKFLPVDGI